MKRKYQVTSALIFIAIVGSLPVLRPWPLAWFSLFAFGLPVAGYFAWRSQGLAVSKARKQLVVWWVTFSPLMLVVVLIAQGVIPGLPNPPYPLEAGVTGVASAIIVWQVARLISVRRRTDFELVAPGPTLLTALLLVNGLFLTALGRSRTIEFYSVPEPGPVPPVLWLLSGMAFFEFAALCWLGVTASRSGLRTLEGEITWGDIEGFEWLSRWIVRVRLRRRPGLFSVVEDPIGFFLKRRDFITNQGDRDAVHASLSERLPELGEGLEA